MNLNTVLDLRYNGELDPIASKLFDQISVSIRNDYNDLISELSKPNKDNIYWWINEVSTRNTLASPFYYYYCSINYIYELIEKSNFKFNKIIVDTKNIKNVLESIFEKNNIMDCSVVVNSSLKFKFKKFLKKQIGDIYLLFYNILRLLIAKFFFRSRIIKDKDLVLIDTFITPGYTNSKRWYGSFWNSLSVSMKQKTFFVPTIIKCSISELISIFYQLTKNSENYIIKEVYLTFSDLKYALNYRKKCKQFKINEVIICGEDFSRIVEECIVNPIDIYVIQESLLTYKFIERLKEKDVKVRLAIDWFEGHALDKVWNAGFKNYYPLTKTIGYRAFESFPLYLCSYPIPIEYNAGILPDSFAVQGLKTAQSIKEFMPDINTILIPAFKADYVWNHREQKKKTTLNNILVTMPISIEISKLIISMVIGIGNKIENRKYNFIVKPHPTRLDNKIFNGLLKDLPENVKFTSEKSFPKLLNESDILITEASSTCLEAISIGVPELIIRGKSGVFLNPIPKDLDKELYRFCSSKEDIIANINHYYNLNDLQRHQLKLLSQKIKANYFEPITQEGINRFLNIDNQKVGSYS